MQLKKVVLVVLVALVGASASAKAYRLVDLGANIRPLAVNNRQQVLCIAQVLGGTKVLLWDRGSFVDIGAVVGGEFPSAIGLNNLSQIACISRDSVGNMVSRYNYLTGALDVTGLDWATGIDQLGRVLGQVESGEGTFASIWQDGVVIPLDERVGWNVQAVDGNSNGVLVGSAMTEFGENAIVWTSPDNAININLAGMNQSSAKAISENGYVAGWADMAVRGVEQRRGIIWRGGGNYTDVGTLGGRNTIANDINTSLEVVGQSTDRRGVRKAFKWQAGRMVSVNNLVNSKYIFDQAYAINNLGDVAVTGIYRGVSHGFIVFKK